MASDVPRAWLFTAAGDDRGHGGNIGYDDQIDAYYSWDDHVPNHKQVAKGDLVAVWDKQTLLGVSVIEEVEIAPGVKTLRRCPHCRTTRISERKNRQPRFRCMKCREEFALPKTEERDVTTYRARYDAGWTNLDANFTSSEVRGLAEHPGDFNAIRPIVAMRLERLLQEHQAHLALRRVAARADIDLALDGPGKLSLELPQGFRHTMVRVRRGQRQFRENLLAQQGNVCAFTGAAPPKVLEAGHLYSYAEVGTHFEFGGLMLRRDIHRLFDDGEVAIEPGRLEVDVSPSLSPYPQYSRLQGQRVAVDLRSEQIDWLEKHWLLHRESQLT